MATAQPETRSYYLDEFADEVMPCDSTLEAWAEWLSKPDDNWPHEVPDEGASFEGSAILWNNDIVATRSDGKWSLSREPSEDNFVAIRFAKGLGWSPDNIVNANCEWRDGEYIETESVAEAVIRMLTEMDDCCGDTEYIAVGASESGWSFTYRANPPRLEAERQQ